MDHQAFAQLLGNYGEFVGAIAVVATLLYLARQIRQNTTATQSARLEGHFQTILEWYRQLKDPDVAAAWMAGIRGFRDLKPAERAQFHAMAMQVILSYEQARNLVNQGLYSSEALAPQEEWIVAFINTPGGSEWWADSASDWNDQLKLHLKKRSAEIQDYVPSPFLVVENDTRHD